MNKGDDQIEVDNAQDVGLHGSGLILIALAYQVAEGANTDHLAIQELGSDHQAATHNYIYSRELHLNIQNMSHFVEDSNSQLESLVFQYQNLLGPQDNLEYFVPDFQIFLGMVDFPFLFQPHSVSQNVLVVGDEGEVGGHLGRLGF